MKSLQNKIFLFFVLLLLTVQAIAFWTLYNGNKSRENSEVQNRLSTAKTIFSELFDRRLSYLAVFAETAAKDYGLKEVFNDDTRSLLVALNNHRKRIDADLAMAIAADGVISGQLQRQFTLQANNIKTGIGKIRQGPERGQEFRFSEWLTSGQPAHLYTINDDLYQLSLSPVNVGTKTIGWIAFGFQIDHRLAQEFTKITGLTTDFVINVNNNWRFIASSQKQIENQKELTFAETVIKQQTPENYIATSVIINEFDQQEFAVAMYGLRANFVALLEKQWWQLLVLTALTLTLSLISAYVIAASISKPIKRLVAQAKVIANGNYHQTITLKDKNEIGQLADEFNHMQSAVLQRQQAIIHNANHDSLTDLPNRNALVEKIRELTDHNQRFALLHINLSRLGDVNSTLGHNVGDYVIKELAERLKVINRNEFCLSLTHLGSDEFILLTNDNAINQTTALIKSALEPVFDYQGISLQLQVRIGIALYPTHASDGNLLIQKADTALHQSKENSNSIQMYQPELDVNTVDRLNLINDLKQAIPAGELELHFQPKLCLKSKEITHAEALVRWQHPTLGMIPPDDFIHIAEKTGQIKALTRWVFSTAIAQYNTWQTLGIDLNVAVNISAANLKEADFYQYICQSLKAANVPTHKITLEVTESSVVDDPEAAITLLKQFKSHGIKISIDDYGTGYSSLAQLKQLPVHELKIDKSFVQRLEHDTDDQTIVRSTIELAHNMGLYVVAEGIEDEFSLRWLARHQCELAQGYFISKPKPAPELTDWLLTKPTFLSTEQSRDTT